MFSRFLDRQASALAEVCDRASLAAWHRQFAPYWVAHADDLVREANEEFQLSEACRLKDELGYLAVERAPEDRQAPRSLWVLLSANPGWSPEVNPIERTLKQRSKDDGTFDVEYYENLRTRFFPRWYDEVVRPHHHPRRAAWWNHASIFLHEVADSERPPQMCSFDPSLDVIGWELWPFHSTRDGLTRAVVTSSSLRDFAIASLHAACRMGANGVVVASKAGYEILHRELASELECLPSPAVAGNVPCSVLRHRETRCRIFAIRRQLFSGWGVLSRARRHDVINWIRTGGGDSVGGSAIGPEVPPPGPLNIRMLAHDEQLAPVPDR